MENLKNNYSIGDLVFAKMRFYPWWPAMITSCEEMTCNVMFFATNQTAVIKIGNLRPYQHHYYKEVAQNKNRSRVFKLAMEQMRRELEDDDGPMPNNRRRTLRSASQVYATKTVKSFKHKK